MRDTINPALEFSWRPALWAAGVLILVGLVGNTVLARPQLLGHGALIAGVVAAFRSGYYDDSGNSAAIGVLLGVLVVMPLLLVTRLTALGIEGSGDTVFFSIALGLGWLIIVVMILLPLAYIGAVVGDFVRKRVDGRLGYDQPS
jgi:hypothetical protein